MPDPTEPVADEILAEPGVTAFAELASFEGAAELVATAIRNGVAAMRPEYIGDSGVAYVVPEQFKVHTIDQRNFEDEPRLPSYVTDTLRFTTVDSVANYVSRHLAESSLLYVRSPFGKGLSFMTSDTDVATVILDDHPPAAGPSAPVGRRQHKAVLTLRPTTAARRWGHALSGAPLDQETFLDLVVDGLTEIASPDGAVLRDLVQDLHAIRSTEIKSVIRTGGEGAIQLAENVKLHAGTADQVTFPEAMTLRLTLFAGFEMPTTLQVRIKPAVRQDHVTFTLSCALLDDAVNVAVENIANVLADVTGLFAHWQP